MLINFLTYQIYYLDSSAELRTVSSPFELYYAFLFPRLFSSQGECRNHA